MIHPLRPLPIATLNVDALLESLIYAAAAVVFVAVLLFIFVKVMPFSVRKEIEEDQNTSLGILMGSVLIGLAIIMAAAMK